MKSIDKASKFYKVKKKELQELYPGKFLVIKDGEVEGAYDTHAKAYEAGRIKYEVGSFLIQMVASKE
ncbi:MAG: hypothetical protein H0X33_05810 [Taibaiella sp.]|nr:hypothetical protein [Taibaiella sp.]